jgi:4-diphosphocytidyl-2-C-methyl-D-erythritol kinase
MSIHRALAPAKVNLGLFLGPTRPHDLRHELVTVMQSISLADELTLEPRDGPGGGAGAGAGSAGAGAGGDEVICPGVEGAADENLALRALRAFREATGWDAPPQRLMIEKRIPVAAGLGGGSADAAAALRLARQASGLGDEALLGELARGLGADVPAQVSPGCWLATGAGEKLRRLADPGGELAVLVLPLAGRLSTAAVYEEADRLAIARSAGGLDECLGMVAEAWARGTPRLGSGAEELVRNDLQQPAVLLCPEILDLLTHARASGADVSFVSGSGPTVVGLFAGEETGPRGRAERAAGALAGLVPAPIWAEPVDESFARARREGAPGTPDSPPDGAVRHNLGQTLDE